MRTLGITIAAAFLLHTSLIRTAVAQSILGSTATITGTVTDPLNATVDGATIQAKGAQAASTFKATSDKDGKYKLAGLPPGSYDIQVSATSLKAFDQKGLTVKAGEALKLDARLDYNTQLGTLGEDRLTAAADAKRHHPPSGPAPRTVDGKPDLSGVY